jgi:hypothetical protein
MTWAVTPARDDAQRSRQMPFTVTRKSLLARPACQICRSRKDNVLCFECHRPGRDRPRARLVADAVSLLALVMPFGCPNKVLTDAKLAHRRRMLQHLTTRRLTS